MIIATTYALTETTWIAAPPERVFEALTDPTEILRWWSVPDQYQTTEAELDLRVGGAYRLSGTSVGGGTFEVRGEYVEIDRPNVLSYTWSPGWEEGALGSVVRIELEAEAGGTRVKVRHTGFRTATARYGHQQGWPAVLAALSRHVGVA